MSEKWSRNFAESGDFHITFGLFYMPQSTTWDRRLYFPSEGRRAEDFFARKIRRFPPGLNSRTWLPKLKGYYRNNLLNVGFTEMNNDWNKRQDFVDDIEISCPITERNK
jgi:hypothetical protein